MTEEQIIKALECHIKLHCWDDCPNAAEERQLLNKACSRLIAEDGLDLINRQKAENDELKQELDRLKSGIRNLIKELGE